MYCVVVLICKNNDDVICFDRKRRRNWLALEMRTTQRKKEYEQYGLGLQPQQQRIQRKLAKYREKYATSKLSKPAPWGKNFVVDYSFLIDNKGSLVCSVL